MDSPPERHPVAGTLALDSEFGGVKSSFQHWAGDGAKAQIDHTDFFGPTQLQVR